MKVRCRTTVAVSRIAMRREARLAGKKHQQQEQNQPEACSLPSLSPREPGMQERSQDKTFMVLVDAERERVAISETEEERRKKEAMIIMIPHVYGVQSLRSHSSHTLLHPRCSQTDSSSEQKEGRVRAELCLFFMHLHA